MPRGHAVRKRAVPLLEKGRAREGGHAPGHRRHPSTGNHLSGFGSITGFDSAREVPGIMPNKLWYQKNTKTGFLPGFTVSDSIGQGDVNVTPLQLAMAYAAIGNGGTLYKPGAFEDHAGRVAGRVQ